MEGGALEWSRMEQDGLEWTGEMKQSDSVQGEQRASADSVCREEQFSLTADHISTIKPPSLPFFQGFCENDIKKKVKQNKKPELLS